MKLIAFKDDGKVTTIHHQPHRLTEEQKQKFVAVDGIPKRDRDPSLWLAQLYYDKEKQSLYYKYTERPQDEEIE